MLFLVLVVVFGFGSASPYVPSATWTYYLEGARASPWPNCEYRFLSYPGDCKHDVNLWNGAGVNEEWTLLLAPDNVSFHMRASCGSYLSYSAGITACDNVLFLSPLAESSSGEPIRQTFRFIPVQDYQPGVFSLEAFERGVNCSLKYFSFPVACSRGTPDSVFLVSSPTQYFRIHPASSLHPRTQHAIATGLCADPFCWYSPTNASYFLICTDQTLALYSSSSLRHKFQSRGTCLGGHPPEWAKSGDRWAPENTEILVSTDREQVVQERTRANPRRSRHRRGLPTAARNYLNFVFFADQQNTSTIHRVGWALSTHGIGNKRYDKYSANYLTLSGAPGGDIDPHVYHDKSTGNYYLVWKSDDNNAGDLRTRIWIQHISFTATGVNQLSTPSVILDSTGLWWAPSFVNGGSLVEAPEIVKYGSYYYLFFAAGKFCQMTYSEGVARSTSIFGPYEKMLVPFLSSGIVGNGADGSKLMGPGHATFVADAQNASQWFAIWHASLGNNCKRYPFMGKVKFTSDGWPFVDLLTR